MIALVVIATMSACSDRDPVANDANGEGLPEPMTETAPGPAGEPPDNGSVPANGSTPAAAAAIPPALHGRWGLTPGDCTSGRGDAKGLLVVSDRELRFYESRAVPGADAQSGQNSINGHFNFTGEGQSWSKFEALKVTGTKLVRTENNPAASYTYAKC